MADTYTTNLNLTKPEPGAAEDTWGISLNDDLDTLDAIFSSSGTQINLNPNQVNFADNKKAIFGTGSDLEIYHDGSNSYIKDVGTGNLWIGGVNVHFGNPTASEYYIQTISNGAVTLYYDNAAKLATTSTGIDVTGTVTSDGLTVDGLAEISAQTNGAYALRVGDAAGSSGSVAGIGKIGINPQGAGTFTYTGTEIRATENALGDYRARLSFHTRGSTSDVEPLERLRIDQTGDISFYDDTGTSQRLFWDASTERLGIGTTSPQRKLHVIDDAIIDGASGANLYFRPNTSYSGSGNFGIFTTGLTSGTYESTMTIKGYGSGVNDVMTIKGLGKVGIGTNSPQDKLSIEGGNVSINNGSAFQVGGSVSGNTVIGKLKSESGVLTLKADSTRDVQFGSETNGTAMFIEGSNGKVAIGNTSPAKNLHITDSASPTIRFSRDNSFYWDIGHTSSDFQFISETGGTILHMNYDGNVGIGTSSPSNPLHVYHATTDTVANFESGDASVAVNFTASDNSMQITTSGTDGIIKNNGAGNFRLFNNGSERARIDSSGNLLVGKTTTSNATAGAELNASGQIVGTFSSGTHILGRNTNDGSILEFQKDGTIVGSINVAGGDISIGTGDVGFQFWDGGDAIYAWNPSTNSVRDGAIDLGYSGGRFQDIYATNGTIQTSDINEKQDIEDLSEAETRVAVAAKGLLKKYRWKSAVADKGDDARIHFGIMAQDLENAFANEGLDAGDYGMFISTTWTDEATGEEKTRLGVRYNELLAFIIAAI